MSTNPIIYVGNFDQPYPSQVQQGQYADAVADLQGSGFTTAILWNLHVDPLGNLRYTNAQTPLISDGKLQKGYGYLPELLASLTEGGSVDRVLFSMGGWGTQTDYVNCGQLLAQYGTGMNNPLVRNLVALQAMGVSGIDMDLETGGGRFATLGYAYYLPTVVQLTNLLYFDLHLQVTYCPYTAQQFWLDCLACCNAPYGRQPVSWLNLQCYSGGAGNTQSQWATAIREYGQSSASLGDIGVDNPAAFVMPGYGVPGICPTELQSNFSDPKQMSAGTAGGFIFTYGGIQQNQQDGTCAPNNTTADYASAIIDGIAALPAPADRQQRLSVPALSIPAT